MHDAAAQPDPWAVAHAAAMAIGTFDTDSPGCFALAAGGGLRRLAHAEPGAVLHWNPASGWHSALQTGDPHADLLELYLPISSATASRPITIGHLGQSLDGFIATRSGDALSVTGPENILHLHRLRALCDAVVVGAGTVAADNPRLTTRLVSGRNPMRVILDPGCRLPAAHTVFRDGAATTLRVCAAGTAAAQAARARGRTRWRWRRRAAHWTCTSCCGSCARGCSRVFVEGGGVTVSSFLQAGLLDRLHIAIAPLLIGEGVLRSACHPRCACRIACGRSTASTAPAPTSCSTATCAPPAARVPGGISTARCRRRPCSGCRSGQGLRHACTGLRPPGQAITDYPRLVGQLPEQAGLAQCPRRAAPSAGALPGSTSRPAGPTSSAIAPVRVLITGRPCARASATAMP